MAIVAPIAGTTRDVIESAFDLGGYPILLSDTAGLRETEDFVESEGIRRALSRAKSSDLIIMVVDASSLSGTPLDAFPSKDTFFCHRMKTLGLEISPGQKGILLFNKIDLLPQSVLGLIRNTQEKDRHFVSCTTHDGMDDFVGALTGAVADLCGASSSIGEASLTQQRHRDHLEACLARLGKFWERLKEEDVVLAANEVQQALRCIGKISGQVYMEEVLDVIFRDFCIGK